MKQLQFEQMQRDFEQSLGPRVDERIRNEKMLWEQEQNFLIRKEICKLNEERGKELGRAQEELSSEKEKFLHEHERYVGYLVGLTNIPLNKRLRLNFVYILN